LAFSPEQLRKIANWEPAATQFIDVDPFLQFIAPALESLPTTYSHSIIERGDNGNYAHIFVYPVLSPEDLRESRHHRPVIVDGLNAYLSLTTPIAAIGFAQGRIASGSVGAGILDLDHVIEPTSGIDAITDAVLNVVANTPYQFVNQAFLSDPLPDDIVPDEYCLGREPWDRIFHILFANSD
jgi:hypothetical protein